MHVESVVSNTGWHVSLRKTSRWLSSDSSGSWWAATVATYCPGRMTEHLKSKSTGGFYQADGSPSILGPKIISKIILVRGCKNVASTNILLFKSYPLLASLQFTRFYHNCISLTHTHVQLCTQIILGGEFKQQSTIIVPNFCDFPPQGFA